jgi:hypothetical protein
LILDSKFEDFPVFEADFAVCVIGEYLLQGYLLSGVDCIVKIILMLKMKNYCVKVWKIILAKKIQKFPFFQKSQITHKKNTTPKNLLSAL